MDGEAGDSLKQRGGHVDGEERKAVEVRIQGGKHDSAGESKEQMSRPKNMHVSGMYNCHACQINRNI